ncbi:MAG: MlaD family protein [Methylococcaceae bacterium]
MGKNNHALMTGLFLLVLVAATTVIIFWIGNFQQERNNYVISTQTSVTGLNPESTVFFRGIAVGKVLSIKFDPNDSGTILVPVEIDKNIVLTKGVYATLQLKGVTGLTQIQLEDAGNIPEPLPIGDNPWSRIPLVQSLTDKLLTSGEDILKKTDHLMIRLSALLSDENEKNISDILGNLKTLTDKLSSLQKSVDVAIATVPALSADAQKSLAHFNVLSTDARKTLRNIDSLTNDLHNLTKEVKSLSVKANNLVDTSKVAGDDILKTTLPKVNDLLTELQSTSQQVKRVASLLEANPQALLLGPAQPEPGPGEPGYKEPR